MWYIIQTKMLYTVQHIVTLNCHSTFKVNYWRQEIKFKKLQLWQDLRYDLSFMHSSILKTKILISEMFFIMRLLEFFQLKAFLCCAFDRSSISVSVQIILLYLLQVRQFGLVQISAVLTQHTLIRSSFKPVCACVYCSYSRWGRTLSLRCWMLCSLITSAMSLQQENRKCLVPWQQS